MIGKKFKPRNRMNLAEEESLALHELIKQYQILKQMSVLPKPLHSMMTKALHKSHKRLLIKYPSLPSIEELSNAPVQPLKIVAGDEV